MTLEMKEVDIFLICILTRDKTLFLDEKDCRIELKSK